MAKKLMSFKTKGMNQDLSVSAFNPEFAFENMNLRLSTVEGNTMMSWVNEKGTAYITLKEWEDNTKNTSILGTPLGTAILNHQVVLFTTEKTTDKIPEGQIIPNDHIYLLKWAEGDSPTMVGKELYRGNLKFSINHPIETLVSYENELIQKVYWTDGLNQPRVINIVGDIKPSLDTQFDFIPELQLQEKVSIKKQIGGGSFPAGVIQYCFTYFNKYMQESNIFYTSPLFYVSHANRAGSPEDTSIANSFKIRVEGVDDNFDYVRIYSVQRTSLNGTPIAKRVADIEMQNIAHSFNWIEKHTAFYRNYSAMPLIYNSSDIIGNIVEASDYQVQSMFPSSPTGVDDEIEITPGGSYTFYESSDTIWYGFLKENYPHLSIKTGDKYITWEEDATDDSILWVSNKTIVALRNGQSSGFGNFYAVWATRGTENATPLYVNASSTPYISFIEYTDTGVNGDSIDPTELLYEGGYGIIAGTIEQKDSTLFMGNLIQSSLSKYDDIKDDVKDNVTIGYNNMIKTLKLEDSVSGSDYFNELNIETKYTDLQINYTDNLISTGHIGASCANFRSQNYYRLGVQFQDKLGVWTSPIYLKDEFIPISDNNNYWKEENNTLKNSTFYGKIPGTIAEHLYEMGYRKARAVAVMPNYEDRVVLYQGVVNPTMYTKNERVGNTLYAQPSWFFRPLYKVEKIVEATKTDEGVRDFSFIFSGGATKENIKKELDYDSIFKEKTMPTVYSPAFDSFYYGTDITRDSGGNTTLISPFKSGNYLLNNMEVQGDFEEEDRFKIDWQTVTLNSPDLEFYDVEGAHSELLGIKFRQMGVSIFDYTNSMIDIQTETPTVNSNSAGAKFNNKLFKGIGGCGIGSGLWYEDYIIDEEADTSNFKYKQTNIRAWIVYPWQRDGSLNNDITRPSDGGVQTAKLKKKVIANLRYANTSFYPSENNEDFNSNPVLFMSDQNIIEKINSSKIYRGNIDTLQTSRFDTGNYGATPDDLDPRDWELIDTTISPTFKALIQETHNLYSATNKSYYDAYLDCGRIPRPLQKGKGNYPSDKNLYDELKTALNNWNEAFENYMNTVPQGESGIFTEDERDFLEDCATNFSNFKVEELYPEGMAYIGGVWYFGTAFDTDTTVVYIDKLLQTVLKYAKEKHIYWLKTDDGGVYDCLGPKEGADREPSGHDWSEIRSDVGDTYTALRERKSLVRIKYKSTPHLVLDVKGIEENNQSVYWNLSNLSNVENKKYVLPIINIERDIDDESFKNTIFGGQSEDALKANIWVPCGEPVNLPSTETDTYFYYLYGDTYYQRYDCLKTYPFTPEDVNQIVEIGSFMLESYVNIDGRYDRNRGQANNLNMTPQNFNLLNPVYSQRDNFFTYRIQEDDYYKNKEYPNQITWSKTKASGDETDMWTNVTMANTLEMDGDKGEVNKLIRLNDQLLCFQDTGIAQILYNDNVQIASTTGVPIEIANSQKVQGKRYLSNTIGCSNKWSMVSTPAGIYFMDNVNKSIMMFNGQLNNLSQTGGFNTWCKKNILNTKGMWTPTDFNGDFVSYYDTINQDILFIGGDRALAFSEKFGTFTSFYDYGDTPYFCNLDGKGIWFKSINDTTTDLWQHQAGEYCEFFSTPDKSNYCSYWMTLVGNPEPQTDKIFTNLEFRATIDTDGKLDNLDGNKFTPLLPFDSLEVWDEYQHGYASLENLTKHLAYTHGNESSSLKRKFRMWRCDIPRNNCVLDKDRDGHYDYSTDTELNVSRHIRKPMDRMRNPWLYLKLTKNPDEDNNYRTELHDFVMTYFN